MSLDAALAAAKRGWAAFPVYFDGARKHPAVKWRDWATTDVDTLIAEWSARAYPAAGIECEKSGLVVIDEDTLGEFKRLAASQGESVPVTYAVRTGRVGGGRQYYFAADGHGLRSTDMLRKHVGYDIDVKGAGGYVVAAGSKHPSGATYQIEHDADLADVPTWLVDILTEHNPGGHNTGWTDPDLDDLVAHGVPAGQSQDNTLRDVVWELRAKAVSREATRAVWDAIVAKTPLIAKPPHTKPEPWTGADFDRHWTGADNKIGPPLTFAPAAEPTDLPPLVRLDEFLATPDDELAYRVDRLWPAGGRVILAAAWKAGKTTLLGNLIRSLVDGQPFLGTYEVQPARRVILIDDELDQRTLRRWLREQGIANTGRVELIALRGKVGTFNIVDPTERSRWAKHIGPGDVLLLDCLRPILDALGLDESHDVGRFLVPFDALLAEAGIGEAAIAHHMGHAGERSRGDSRLRDWPDVEWRLVRDKSRDVDGETDPGAPRYFAAYGRDVDQPEQLLGYDTTTRRLSITGGSRKDAHAEALVAAVVQFVKDNPGCSQNQLETGVEGRAGDIRKARDLARSRGLINAEKVLKKWIHTPCSSARPNSSGRTDEPHSQPRPLVLYEDEDEGESTRHPAKINQPDEDEQPDAAAIALLAAELGAEVIT
jgi:Bifunctional DNA primase/polymerase, N-terminal/AAA domain